MQRLVAIAAVTWKAAFRFRLFWVLAGTLLAAVVLLPLLLKDDGSARGFTQILLTYNLSVITALLGFSTLWLACGTLARDIEEGQMQMVVVKPVPRWQVWMGKWLGIVSLDAVLLGLVGLAVFVLLQWRARNLTEDQQAILRRELLVARASLKPPVPDIDAAVDQAFREALQRTPVPASERALVRSQIRERIKAELQLVVPFGTRRWVVDLGSMSSRLRQQPLFLRIKFYTAEPNRAQLFVGQWRIGPPEDPQLSQSSFPMSLAADSYQEFQIPPNLVDKAGKLTIDFLNRNDAALLFPVEDGVELLYREGSFALNYARGLAVVLCWMAALAALGLAAASLVSFPVAAFCSLSLLLVALSTGTLSSVVEEGTVGGVGHEGGATERSWLDAVIVPLFSLILKVVNLARAFSPVDALSSGRSITWGQVGLAVAQVVLLLGGLFCLVGIFLFSRRELATAQQNP